MTDSALLQEFMDDEALTQVGPSCLSRMRLSRCWRSMPWSLWTRRTSDASTRTWCLASSSAACSSGRKRAASSRRELLALPFSSPHDISVAPSLVVFRFAQVVVTSATLDEAVFRSFFRDFAYASFEVSGRTFPIEIQYKVSTPPSPLPQCCVAVASVCFGCCRLSRLGVCALAQETEDDYEAAAVQTALEQHRSEPWDKAANRGHILVFLTGVDEVDRAVGECAAVLEVASLSLLASAPGRVNACCPPPRVLAGEGGERLHACRGAPATRQAAGGRIGQGGHARVATLSQSAFSQPSSNFAATGVCAVSAPQDHLRYQRGRDFGDD